MSQPLKSSLDERLGALYRRAQSRGLTFGEACDLHREINRMLSSLRSGGRKRTRRSERAALRALRAAIARRYRFPVRHR